MGKIIVDVDVWNCQIRAAKPKLQVPMPTNDVGKTAFWESGVIPIDRFNERQYGWLKGRALRKAQKTVDENGAINISGQYGSIQIDEKDFEPWE